MTVNSWVEAGVEQLNLRINAKPDASTTGDMATQLLLGHVPMLLRPESERALVIGLGSGVTCGAVVCHPTLRHLDAVEILPEVVAAAGLFASRNDHVLEDRRLKLVVDDAKSFLQLSKETYDVIISEPSNPWMSGVAGVFSREFYQSCRSHLRPDGLMVQWIHLYENNDAVLDLVMRTFGSVFPSLSVWQSRPLDLILVGAGQPPTINFEAMATRLAEPRVRADLDRIGITRLPVLLSRQVIAAENGALASAREGPAESDLHPVLEYAAARAFFIHENAEGWRNFDENYSPRAATLLAHYLKSHSLVVEDCSALARFHLAQGLPRPDLVRSFLHRWQRDLPQSQELIEFSARLADAGPAYELAAMQLAPLRDGLLARAPAHPDLLRRYARLLLLTYRSQRSIYYTPPSQELRMVLESLLAADPKNERGYQLELAELAWDLGEDDACIRLSEKSFRFDAGGTLRLAPLEDKAEKSAAFCRWVEALERTGQWNRAREVGRQAKDAGYQSPRLDMLRRKAAGVGGPN